VVRSAGSQEDLPDASRHFRDGARPEIRPTNLARDLEYHLAIDDDSDDHNYGGSVGDLPRDLQTLGDADGPECGGLRSPRAVEGQDARVLVDAGRAIAGLAETTANTSTTPRNSRFI
jgi:hypothetical protein